MVQGMGGETLEHVPVQAQPSKGWGHIHALDFPVCRVTELDSSESGRNAIAAYDEKGHLLFKELRNTIPVMIFYRIERMGYVLSSAINVLVSAVSWHSALITVGMAHLTPDTVRVSIVVAQVVTASQGDGIREQDPSLAAMAG